MIKSILQFLASATLLASAQDLAYEAGAVIRTGAANPERLSDNNSVTGILIPASLPDEQYIILDLSAANKDFPIKGVWLHTDQSQMSSGTITFSVDGVPCPDTNGVGVAAIGGAFNCNLTGRQLEIRCTDTCSPYFAVYEMHIYSLTILSAIPEGESYIFAGNVPNSKYPDDVDMVFRQGSYHDTASSWYVGWNTFVTYKGSVSNSGVVFNWREKAHVAHVIMMMSTDNKHNCYRIQFSERAMNFDQSDSGAKLTIFKTSNRMRHWTDVPTDVLAQSISVWRHPSCHAGIYIDKVITLGTFCDEFADGTGLTSTQFSAPSYWKVLSPEEPAINIDIPTYKTNPNDCGDIKTYATNSMTFTFRDHDQFLKDGYTVNLDSWVYLGTNSEGNEVIQVRPNIETLVMYSDKDVTVDIIATAPNGSQIIHQFTLGIVDFVKIECERSILALAVEPKKQRIKVYDQEPVLFSIPAAVDSGTEVLKQTPGFEKDDCGPFSYKQVTLANLVKQKSDLDFSMITDDESLVGFRLLDIEVSSIDYSNFIEPIIIRVQIEVEECEVKELKKPDGDQPFSPLLFVYNLPFETSLQLPMMEPFPNCGLSNTDLSYTLQKPAPAFVRIDQKARSLTFEVDDNPETYGTRQTVSVLIKYKDLSVPVDVTINFMDKKKKTETPELEEEITEDVVEEPAEVIETEPEKSEASTWDGWKALLLQQSLGEDFQLPAPIETEGYVPTPPKAKLNSVSIKGKTEIQFNEDVFEIQNLTNSTIKVPKSRILQESRGEFEVEFEYDEKPLIEISVEPGENSDPSKLQFTYTAEFTSSSKVNIDIIWDTPTYVSANQPEDVLVVTLWGPFYDKQDGLEVQIEERTIRQFIPPQVVPGGLTDAIQSASDSLQASSASILAGNAAINVLLAGSLNQVWGMVNNLQVVLHSPLINIQFPGNAFMIYEVMITVATFDILPTDELFPLIFPNIPEIDAYSPKFDRLGYGSMFIIMNMGTMLIVLFYYLALYLVVLPCARLSAKFGSRRGKRTEKKLRKVLFWDHAIVFLQEGFMEICISALINFLFIADNQGAWASGDLLVSNFLTIFLTVAIIVLIALIAFYLWPRFSRLREKPIKKKYGSTYSMVDVKNRGTWTLLYPLIFFGRRLIFVVAVVMMIKYPAFQILFFMLPTLGFMIHLGQVEPMKNRLENRLEMYNSFTILLLSYCLCCFTPFVLDANARYEVGFAMVFLTAQNILVNLIIIGREPARRTFLRLRYKWYTRQKIKRDLIQKARQTKAKFNRVIARIKSCFGRRSTGSEAETPIRLELGTIQEVSQEDDVGNDFTPKANINVEDLRKSRRIEIQRQAIVKKIDQVKDFYQITTPKRATNPAEKELDRFQSVPQSNSLVKTENLSSDSFSDIFNSHQGGSPKILLQSNKRSTQKLQQKANQLKSEKNGINIKQLRSKNSSSESGSDSSSERSSSDSSIKDHVMIGDKRQKKIPNFTCNNIILDKNHKSGKPAESMERTSPKVFQNQIARPKDDVATVESSSRILTFTHNVLSNANQDYFNGQEMQHEPSALDVTQIPAGILDNSKTSRYQKSPRRHHNKTIYQDNDIEPVQVPTRKHQTSYFGQSHQPKNQTKNMSGTNARDRIEHKEMSKTQGSLTKFQLRQNIRANLLKGTFLLQDQIDLKEETKVGAKESKKQNTDEVIPLKEENDLLLKIKSKLLNEPIDYQSYRRNKQDTGRRQLSNPAQVNVSNLIKLQPSHNGQLEPDNFTQQMVRTLVQITRNANENRENQ